MSGNQAKPRWGFVALLFVVALGAVAAAALMATDRRGLQTTAGPAVAAPPPPDEHAHGQAVTEPGSQVVIPQPVHPAGLPLRSKRQVRAEPEVVDGVKVFRLTAEAVRWEFLPGVAVTAWGYNGQVPGPEIWVDQGDRVRVELENRLTVPTTIHWHGVDVPNSMDGVPGVTQEPIMPGRTFVYEFVAEPSGTFWYHSHFDSARQLDMGLYGAFIVRGPDEATYDQEFVQIVDEWIRLPDGRNGWEGVAHAGHNPGEYNWFTINGKAFPATEELSVAEGDRVRVRVINAGFQAHPMHQHGRRFGVIAKDGATLPQAYLADTVLVGAGERYDYEFVAEAGAWMFHCHIPHHMGNDTVEPGGLMTFVTTEAYRGANRRHT
ncbi:MAG: copper oxidase [Actinomycetota bacterium]|nr:copper oxidase [Actinomycetota bacterium]